MPIDSQKEFKPINISVLTVSDTRTEATDKSGQILANKIKEKGHSLKHKEIVIDDKEKILLNSRITHNGKLTPRFRYLIDYVND